MDSCKLRRRSAACVLDDRERHRYLTFQLIGDADHRDFGDIRMILHRFLNLTRAEAMARNVDHVVGTAHDEVITVGVAGSPVKGGVDLLILERRKIGFDEAFVVAPDGAHAAWWQRRHDAQHPFLVGADLLAGLFVLEFQFVSVRSKAR